MDAGNPTRKDNGVERTRVTVLEFIYNHETHQVQIGGVPMPLSLAQMIADEGMRILEEKRRVAAAMVLKQQLDQALEDKRIADLVRKGR